MIPARGVEPIVDCARSTEAGSASLTRSLPRHSPTSRQDRGRRRNCIGSRYNSAPTFLTKFSLQSRLGWREYCSMSAMPPKLLHCCIRHDWKRRRRTIRLRLQTSRNWRAYRAKTADQRPAGRKQKRWTWRFALTGRLAILFHTTLFSTSAGAGARERGHNSTPALRRWVQPPT